MRTYIYSTPYTYSTRTDAIHEIIAVIESGHVDDAVREFDIDAIADRVLGDYDEGYTLQVSSEEFWDIVARHAR